MATPVLRPTTENPQSTPPHHCDRGAMARGDAAQPPKAHGLDTRRRIFAAAQVDSCQHESAGAQPQYRLRCMDPRAERHRRRTSRPVPRHRAPRHRAAPWHTRSRREPRRHRARDDGAGAARCGGHEAQAQATPIRFPMPAWARLDIQRRAEDCTAPNSRIAAARARSEGQTRERCCRGASWAQPKPGSQIFVRKKCNTPTCCTKSDVPSQER